MDTVALVPFFSWHGGALQPLTTTSSIVIDPLTPASKREKQFNIMHDASLGAYVPSHGSQIGLAASEEPTKAKRTTKTVFMAGGGFLDRFNIIFSRESVGSELLINTVAAKLDQTTHVRCRMI